MSQFFHPDFAIKTIRGKTAHHILNVFRIKSGDKIEIFDGNGKSAEAVIKKTDRKKNEIRIEIGEILRDQKPEGEINIYLAVLKPGPFALAVEKTVELGAARIIPIRTKRSERKKIRRDKIEKIIIAACEQCGRKFLPSLDETKDFLVGIMDWERSGTSGFILSRGFPPLSVGKVATKISFFVGPAGGFAEDEIKTAEKAGLCPVSIAGNTLRSETAAIAVCARAAGRILEDKYGENENEIPQRRIEKI
ncbi:MAG: 16S rRNA (uracil(1498)-N(3))-methyltransferase [Elusimicrobia bacterium]|nr:16S rRNA (uracil(1498)-N(3))-methyltransferase [Elusimicrobiota bacterium]